MSDRSILVLFVMLKQFSVGTIVQGKFFPVLHLNIVQFISVTQKRNVDLYTVCIFVTEMRTMYMQMVTKVYVIKRTYFIIECPTESEK